MESAAVLDIAAHLFAGVKDKGASMEYQSRARPWSVAPSLPVLQLDQDDEGALRSAAKQGRIDPGRRRREPIFKRDTSAAAKVEMEALKVVMGEDAGEGREGRDPGVRFFWGGATGLLLKLADEAEEVAGHTTMERLQAHQHGRSSR